MAQSGSIDFLLVINERVPDALQLLLPYVPELAVQVQHFHIDSVPRAAGDLSGRCARVR